MSARKFDISKTKKFDNVRVVNDSEKISVILHLSEVVRFDKVENKIYLWSAGWETPTTKTAINNALKQLESLTGQSLPAIFQKKGKWMLSTGESFKTGMEISVYPLLRELT
jgi:hypothetical protein